MANKMIRNIIFHNNIIDDNDVDLTLNENYTNINNEIDKLVSENKPLIISVCANKILQYDDILCDNNVFHNHIKSFILILPAITRYISDDNIHIYINQFK
jgi:hypothetical protein